MKKLDVCFTPSPEENRRIGELAEANRKVYFEYDPEFLKNHGRGFLLRIELAALRE
jgi:hypothetical protein